MNKHYTWKRSFLSSTYSIFEDDEQIGYIKYSYFNKTKVEINGKKYHLKSYGLLNRKVNIIDLEHKRVIGKMKYNKRFSKARVALDNNTVYWKYETILRYKWKVHDARGLKIKYKSFLTKGRIYSNTEDDISVFSGLHLAHNYFLILMFLLVLLILIFKYYDF